MQRPSDEGCDGSSDVAGLATGWGSLILGLSATARAARVRRYGTTMDCYPSARGFRIGQRSIFIKEYGRARLGVMMSAQREAIP